MGLRILLLSILLLASLRATAQEEAPPPAPSQQDSFWKVKQGECVDLTPFKFFLPESKNIELRDWKGKAVLIIYVRAFDKPSLDFLKVFEQKAWPELKNRNIICYVVGHGDQMPSLLDWYQDNQFTFPLANDPGHRLHNGLCTMPNAFPHIIALDKDHRFCMGIVGGMDPGSEDFLRLVDQVIDVGCPPQDPPS
jgi:hypothetical protein